MVARGEFAYLVAETAQGLDYGSPPENSTLVFDAKGTLISGTPYVQQKMLSQDAYAAVVWALVMATICSPVMFRWALGVFDRATPVERSSFIGGNVPEYRSRAFVIRVAGRYSPNVQREIFSILHNEGVDVLDAKLSTVRENDNPDADVELFFDNFTVLSRGKKKDLDDEKLEQIHHTLSEALNDADAQIIFEPADEDYSCAPASIKPLAPLGNATSDAVAVRLLC